MNKKHKVIYGKSGYNDNRWKYSIQLNTKLLYLPKKLLKNKDKFSSIILGNKHYPNRVSYYIEKDQRAWIDVFSTPGACQKYKNSLDVLKCLINNRDLINIPLTGVKLCKQGAEPTLFLADREGWFYISDNMFRKLIATMKSPDLERLINVNTKNRFVEYE